MNEVFLGGGGFGGGAGFPVAVTPESTTASNLGAGAGVFKSKVIFDLQFKSLVAGAGIGITVNANDLTIDNLSPGEANTGSNLGSGDGSVFSSKVGVDLQFRRLQAGSGRVLIRSGVPSNSYVDFDTSIANIGAGTGLIFKNYVAEQAQLKTLIQGANITITNGVDDITIAAAAPGEANTASNLGAGAGWFKSKVGVDLQFKSLVANYGTQAYALADTIQIVFAGFNSGTGAGHVFATTILTGAQFRSLVAGSNITISEDANEITIAATGGGEVNLAANVGTGPSTAQVWKDKTGVTLNFKSFSTAQNSFARNLGTDNVRIEVFKQYDIDADQMLSPNNADWAYNNFAALIADPSNASLLVRKMPDAVASSIGFFIELPADSLSFVIQPLWVRAASAIGGASVAVFKWNFRYIRHNTALPAWSADQALTNAAMPNNTRYQSINPPYMAYSSYTMQAGDLLQVQIWRDGANGSDTLTTDLYLKKLQVHFSA